jgi:hypothetical protein
MYYAGAIEGELIVSMIYEKGKPSVSRHTTTVMLAQQSGARTKPC